MRALGVDWALPPLHSVAVVVLSCPVLPHSLRPPPLPSSFPSNTCILQGMNGKMVDGRALTVRVRSEAPSGPRRGMGAPRPDDDLPPECKIYVGSLPQHVDETALTQEFSRFGSVIRWVGEWGGEWGMCVWVANCEHPLVCFVWCIGAWAQAAVWCGCSLA